MTASPQEHPPLPSEGHVPLPVVVSEVTHGAEDIAHGLSEVHSSDERAQVVEKIKEGLSGSGLVILDVHELPDTEEVRGVRTGRTRGQVLHDLRIKQIHRTINKNPRRGR